MAKRLNDYSEPEPGSARWLSRERMKALWANPEYREKITQGQIKRMQDPVHKAKIAATQHGAVPQRFLPYLAVHYDVEVARLRRLANRTLKQAAELEYQAKVCREGGNPKMMGEIFHGRTNRRMRYKSEGCPMCGCPNWDPCKGDEPEGDSLESRILHGPKDQPTGNIVEGSDTTGGTTKNA